MTQPQAPEDNITADQGFNRLLSVLSTWVPARLFHTAQARKGIRSLTGRTGR
jgi:hypothetical protein